MVPGFIPRARITGIVLIALILLGPLAHASVDEGRARFNAYQESLTKQQAAAAQGDGAAYAAEKAKADALLKEARTAFEEGGAIESADVQVIMDYVQVLRALGYDDLAAETIEGATDRGVENAGLWRTRGECLLAVGPSHFQTGVDALRNALTLDSSTPDAANTWFALGKYYLDNLMPGDAAPAFASALALDGSHIPAKLGTAAVKVYAGDIAGAGAILDEVGKGAQPFDGMLRAMARNALYDFDLSRRVFPDTVENHYAYARLLYLATRVPEAVLAARRATDLAPDRVDIWNLLGAMQLQMGEYAGALAAYESSLKVQADQPPIAATVEQLRKVQEEAAKQQAQQAPATQGQGPLRGQGPLK